MENAARGLTFLYRPGVAINYESHGSGGSPMLLLHGFAASLESWRDILPLLAAKHRVYCLDLKGFGLSSWPDDGAYSMRDQAEMVCAFIEHCGLNDLTLVGHSYGGAIALVTYETLMDRRRAASVRSLILIGAAAYPHLPKFIRILRAPLLNRIALNLLPAKWQAWLSLRSAFFDHAKITPELVRRYTQFFNGTLHDSVIEAAKSVVPTDVDRIIERYKEMRIPALLVWGANDGIVPIRYARRLNRDIPGSLLVVIPECGHIPQEEKPQETAGHLIEFMAELEGNR